LASARELCHIYIYNIAIPYSRIMPPGDVAFGFRYITDIIV
jgi:hypothetical protein